MVEVFNIHYFAVGKANINNRILGSTKVNKGHVFTSDTIVAWLDSKTLDIHIIKYLYKNTFRIIQTIKLNDDYIISKKKIYDYKILNQANSNNIIKKLIDENIITRKTDEVPYCRSCTYVSNELASKIINIYHNFSSNCSLDDFANSIFLLCAPNISELRGFSSIVDTLIDRYLSVGRKGINDYEEEISEFIKSSFVPSEYNMITIALKYYSFVKSLDFKSSLENLFIDCPFSKDKISAYIEQITVKGEEKNSKLRYHIFRDIIISLIESQKLAMNVNLSCTSQVA